MGRLSWRAGALGALTMLALAIIGSALLARAVIEGQRELRTVARCNRALIRANSMPNEVTPEIPVSCVAEVERVRRSALERDAAFAEMERLNLPTPQVTPAAPGPRPSPRSSRSRGTHDPQPRPPTPPASPPTTASRPPTERPPGPSCSPLLPVGPCVG